MLLCEPVVTVVSIVLILLIIAVAAAPLMSALPSKVQRYEARIRGHASQCGITIKLEPAPEIPARFGYRASAHIVACLLYTSPSPRDRQKSRMPSSA